MYDSFIYGFQLILLIYLNAYVSRITSRVVLYHDVKFVHFQQLGNEQGMFFLLQFLKKFYERYIFKQSHVLHG